MSTATPPPADPGAELPHWETQPDDLAEATRTIKAAIRERIQASRRTVGDVLAEIEEHIRDEVADIKAERTRGEDVWPVIDFADIEAGTVPGELIAKLHRRGCAVIRGLFPREQAEEWDRAAVKYVDDNHFFEHYRGPADDFFGPVKSKPEIYPIYWSRSQMEARQHPRMATAQAFLNSQWTASSDGHQWFDPDRDSLYPDRLRRRPPGTKSAGLGTHLDPGTLDLWMTSGYQEHFRHLFSGDFASYDPWDAAHRTEAAQYPGSTMCSAFRTFQGWTALSEMRHDQGVLHTVPIVRAMAYLMLRPLADDVPDDDMCSVRPNQVFPVLEQWHSPLLEGLSGIPDVAPGDSVWWHCDMIHAVAPVQDQQGWGNVMYIPAAPWCAKNARYAETVRAALVDGRSPSDFPDENYETNWTGRFTEADLNEIGRRGLGIDA
jgi:hypothetical protein